MPTEVLVLLGLATAYVGLLSFIAWAADRAQRMRRLATHPLVYALALGVYASSWTYFGSVGLAKRSGLVFLAVYTGPTIAAILGPAVGARLLRLVRAHQLTSLADLFAFRYRSRAAGALVAVAALVASLPYIALQIRAAVASVTALTEPGHEASLGFGFCAVIAAFAMFLGARSASSRGAQSGLIVAVAFESVVKLVALLAIGVAGTYAAFGGPAGLEAWTRAHPEAIRALHQPVREGSQWTSMTLLSFAAAFLLPRQFHVAFGEGTRRKALRTASWAFPLYLLILNLPIVPILWAGTTLLGASDPDLYVLGVARYTGSFALGAVAFLGGISAGSAMVIVTMLALASMAINHLVLLAPRFDARGNLYAWLMWARRALIALVALLGWATFLLLEARRGLVDAGVVSFVAFAQFLPGMVGVLAWRRATAAGFVVGLAGGLIVWGLTALAPLLGAPELSGTFGDAWTLATFASLAMNFILFVAVSLRTAPSREELEAADACVRGASVRASTAPVTPEIVEHVRASLGALIGPAAAEGEMQRALTAHGQERLELGMLAERLERNLTAIVGPLLANMIVEASARPEPAEAALAHQLRFLDDRIAREGARLDGLAAELDGVRRFLGALLDDLPIGACALDPAGDVVIWNRALERLTGIIADAATGRPLAELRAHAGESAWGRALGPFASSLDDGEARVEINGAARTVRVHASRVSAGPDGKPQGTMILVEDVTERRALEAQIAHQDRLASIGRLAAGVAHEIGNPLTGISSLAQNLRKEPDPELSRERAEDILEQTRRIEGIVKSLLAFGHAGDARDAHAPMRVERMRAVELVAEALRLVRLDRAARDIAWHNDCAPEHIVVGDRRRLLQVLVNLLTNARDASKPGDHVTIQAVRERDRVRLCISDDGCGIPPAVRARLFDPFVTTKPVGKGTGLGLSVVYGIVREHGGEIQIDSEESSGTTVRVWLPTAEGDA